VSIEFNYGIHACTALLKHRPEYILGLYIARDESESRLQDLLQLAKKNSITIERVKSSVLSNWTKQAVHQGVVVKAKSIPTLDASDLFGHAKKLSKPGFYLAFDGVSDVHNLGACIRSSVATGIDGIILPTHKNASITPAVRKVAAGTAELANIYSVNNLSQTLNRMKKLDYWIIGAAMNGDQTIYNNDWTQPTVLVMGSEGEGLRNLTEKVCDNCCSIPMAESMESLNVSVATAVCLYEQLRQRNFA
jgi:23S rRNA (guanosine2251-2'-O)-methyltransferase